MRICKMRKANYEEQLIFNNLIYQGFKNIHFEPNGNVPPDYLLEDKIAIEVRRLNLNLTTEKGFKGLEQDRFSVNGILYKLMKEVSDKDFHKSALVSYILNRPIPLKSEIKKFVKEVLEYHKSSMHKK